MLERRVCRNPIGISRSCWGSGQLQLRRKNILIQFHPIVKTIAFAGFLMLSVQSSDSAFAQAAASREVLWYTTPAAVWDQALPVGNGRVGGMVFGGANAGSNNGDLQASPKNSALMDGSQTSGADEHLQLNESSLWRGTRADRLNPHAHEAVPQIRKLLLHSKG